MKKILSIILVFVIFLFIIPSIIDSQGGLQQPVVAGVEAQAQQPQQQLQQQTQQQTAQGTCASTYTVVAGDTMGTIAQRCNVTLAALVAANPTIPNPNRIFPGQVINIPTGGIPPTGPRTYTVVTGDTLYRIAVRFGTTVAALQAANPFITNPTRIYPGWVLTIPSGGGIPPTGPRRYTVAAGDTLYRIAVRYNTTVQSILNANPFITNPARIYPGWVLTIP